MAIVDPSSSDPRRLLSDPSLVAQAASPTADHFVAAIPAPSSGTEWSLIAQYAADVDDPAGDQPIRMPPSARPTRTSDEEVRYAVACILRREELWPLLSVGADGRSPDTPSMPIALARAGQRLLSLVWAFAADEYSEQGRLPGTEACRTELRARVQRLPDYQAISEADLDQFLDYVLGPRFDQVDVEHARRVIAELLEVHLCRIPLLDSIRDNLRSGRSIDDEVNRAEQIRDDLTVLRSHRDQHGPFTTAQFQQRVQERVEIVQGVLVEGQLAIIGGPTKSLKTLVALDMAISIATGSPFLGRSLWACDRPRKVGFFSGESGAGTLLAKFHVICGAKQSQLDPPLPAEIRDGVEAHAAANIIWNDALPDLGSMASLRQLQRAIRQQQLDVLFLDPLFLCMGSAGKDMANAALVGQTLMNANRAVTDEGCTLILVHHPSGDKLRRTSAQARDPLELTDLAYPGVTNFCRQWLTINRAAPYEHETRRSELWLNIGGSGLQAGGIYRAAITEGFVHNLWQVRVQTQSECIERERVVRDVERRRDERDRRSRVRRYLLAHPDGVSVRHMTRNQGELAGIGQSGIEQALRDLQGDHGLRVWSEDVGNGVRWFVREIPDPRQWPQRDEGEVAGQG